MYAYVRNNPIVGIDPTGEDTYFVNRKLGSAQGPPASKYNPLSHQLGVTTGPPTAEHPNGVVEHTSSWNAGQTTLDDETDIGVALEALDQGQGRWAGGEELATDLPGQRTVAEDGDILRAVVDVNRERAARFVATVDRVLAPLADKIVAVLGLAFKPNTDDMRDAPSLVILPELAKQGARIQAHDPVGMEEARKLMPDLHYFDDAYDAVAGADVLVILTEWNSYRALDLARLERALRRAHVPMAFSQGFNPHPKISWIGAAPWWTERRILATQLRAASYPCSTVKPALRPATGRRPEAGNRPAPGRCWGR